MKSLKRAFGWRSLFLFGWIVTIAKQDYAQDYVSQVKPVLQQRCYACHGALKQEGGLRLDTVVAMRIGGESGPVFNTSEPSLSEILQRVRHDDLSQRMPPEGEPLTEQQIGWIESWIKGGSLPPEDDQPQSDPRQHWAFQLPRQSELPVRNFSRDSQSQSAAGTAMVHNPIDCFLTDKHAQLGIQPLPPADKQTLVRRLYVDLLGILPRPDEVDQFLADTSPGAYESLIDQLLSRSEYGERWGRHWMDVWRYSDWYGRRAVPDVMNSYPQIWRWRDWIIRSLNEDKGYDRMVMEMLAADELCPTEDDNVVATGFLVRNWYKWNYETWMKDNVEHTSKAFLGLTLNCAHCHDHKYDPISHEDYFRFRAFFEPLELRHDRVVGQADPGPFKKYVYAESYGPIKTGAIRVFDEKLDAATYMYGGGDARNRIEGRPAVLAGPPKSLCSQDFRVDQVSLPPEAYYPGLKEFVRRDELQQVTGELEQAKSTLAAATVAVNLASEKLTDLRQRASGPATAANQPTSDEMAAAGNVVVLASADVKIASSSVTLKQAKLESLNCRIAADDARFRSIGNADLLTKLASRAERQAEFAATELQVLVAEKSLMVAEQKLAATDKTDEAKQAAAKQDIAKAEPVLQSARKSLDAARAALHQDVSSYTPLSPSYPTTSSGRRLALARWIASSKNPLTARVAVNHIWLRHFGQALVETTDNFGVQGKLPDHQEILDWLAVELSSHGWSMKHIHRIILQSQAYQRSSTVPKNHPAMAIDRENRNYWKTAVRRMEAEVVRDSILASADSLDRTLGGPDIDIGQWQTTGRRSLYFTVHGEAKMQFMDTFDGPNVCDCYRRTSTILPQQALAMTNSELTINYGRMLAKKILEEVLLKNPELTSSTMDQPFIERAFRQVINRPASDQELAYSLQFLREQQELLQSSDKSQLQNVGSKEVAPAAADTFQRARENLTISLFSHNDFVTLR